MFCLEGSRPGVGGGQARPERRGAIRSPPPSSTQQLDIWRLYLAQCEGTTGRAIHDCMKDSMHHKAFKLKTCTLPGWGTAIGWIKSRSALSRFTKVLPCCQGIHTSCNKWLSLLRARLAPHTVFDPYLEDYNFHGELGTKREGGTQPSMDFSSTSIPHSQFFFQPNPHPTSILHT